MRTITLIRHGQSLANAGGVTMAHHAIPPTDLGHRQAALPSEVFYWSKALPEAPSF